MPKRARVIGVEEEIWGWKKNRDKTEKEVGTETVQSNRHPRKGGVTKRLRGKFSPVKKGPFRRVLVTHTRWGSGEKAANQSGNLKIKEGGSWGRS